MLPFRPLRLHPPEQPVEQRDVQSSEHEREPDVVEVEPPEGDERHHQDRGKRRKRDVPAAVLEDPVVQVGRPAADGELAIEERVRLVDEVRRERLMREHAAAGDGVGDERDGEQDQIDAIPADLLAPTHRQEAP